MKTPKFLYIIIPLFIAGLIAGFFIVKKRNGNENLLTVHPGDFVQQVSVSGKVVAAESVDLAFSQTGRIASVYAKVGDKVLQGTVIASIENGDARAEILQKEAAYTAAEARLASLEVGTRPEQIAVTESNVASAQTAVDQSYTALFDSLRNAYTQSDDAIRRRTDQFINSPASSQPKLKFTVDPQLQSDIEWQRFLLEQVLITWEKSTNTLNSASDITAETNAATKNLDQVRNFLDNTARALNSLTPTVNMPQSAIDAYRSDISTARGNINTAVISLTSAITAQKNSITALMTAKRNLELAEAGATKEDIAAQKAQVSVAEADLESARARYQKTLVAAPFSGIITTMDAKVGSSATSNSSLISMISIDTLQIESFIPEVNIPFIKIANEGTAILDAYGEGVPFGVKVVSIDPAETVRDGVSTYRAKLQFTERDERIKSGMTANIIITTEKKSSVIAVPQGTVIIHGDKKFVQVKENSAVLEREVHTGGTASNGTIEIISGLKDGDAVLLNSKK